MIDAIDHPDDKMLLAMSQGQLAESEIARLSAHLNTCFSCCQRIDQLVTDDQLINRLKAGAGRDDALVDANARRSAVRALQTFEETRQRTHVNLPLPKVIGDHDILAEVGRGGMGVVFQARHRGLRRIDALKMVLAGEFSSRSEGLRFRLEAELAARVKHPNIVQVHSVGDHAGRPYLVLEWIDGGSLEARLDGTPWPPDQAAALVETLAQAIHAAHREGVVHRDLKPANIMLTTDGTPKITDFGLAAPVEVVESLTRTGTLVGTPAYMAPEQATGDRALIGPATDTYALGVILYQLTTGRLPFPSANTLELLQAITDQEPVRPRTLRTTLSSDLEAVVLQCLEKEPVKRYASAWALAEDLKRYREHQPVTARPAGTVARFVRACRRRPVIASLLALLAISIVTGLAGVTWKWREANANARQAADEATEARYQSYRASLSAACAALEIHDVAAAARHLQTAPESLRAWEWKHLHSRLDDSTATIPLTDAGGQLIHGGDSLHIGILGPDGLHVTDLDGVNVQSVPFATAKFQVFHAVRTRQGLRIATWNIEKSIDVLDETGAVRHRMASAQTHSTTVVTLSPDGARLACARVDQLTDVEIFDVASGHQIATCRGHTDTIWAIAFSPDGTRLATGGEDRILRLWNATTGTLIASAPGHTGKIVHATFHPDGTRVLTASSDDTVRQWDASTGQPVEPAYERHIGEALAACYSPDGQRIASVGSDRIVRLWTAAGRQDLAVRHGHTGRIGSVAFTPDGRRLASIGGRSPWVAPGEDAVRVWDADPAATLPVLRGHAKAVHPLAYSPDGRWLATGSRDATVRLWDAATGRSVAVMPHPAHVWDLAYGPDGKWLVTVNTHDNKLRIWDIATATIRKEIPTFVQRLQKVTVSPDGARVAISATHQDLQDKRLCVFDLATGRRLLNIEGSSLAYSPDGRHLVALAADDRTLLLLNAQTFEITAHLAGHEGVVTNAVFSSDGRLASCGADRTVRIWSLADGSCHVLGGHTDTVFSVAFHPDGNRLVAGCMDGGVWLWDLTRHAELVRLPGHRGFVWSLAFSPDGSTLASASGDKTIRLWDTSPLKSRYLTKRDALSLTPDR